MSATVRYVVASRTPVENREAAEFIAAFTQSSLRAISIKLALGKKGSFFTVRVNPYASPGDEPNAIELLAFIKGLLERNIDPLICCYEQATVSTPKEVCLDDTVNQLARLVGAQV